ncbi:MAG: type I 3-dehydroquinate dehydratase [Chthoniobacterales bacterium]
MAAHTSVKARRPFLRLVGVIRSQDDLRFAIRMRNPPDLFEVRLDHLVGIVNELENKLSMLPAPLIITARHPREGGANKLSIKRRHELLSRFLPRARYVDVELRSAKALRSLLAIARRKNVRRIISFHNFRSTPSTRSLRARARAAKSCGADIFKVATRTDTPAQLAQLLDFIANKNVDLAVSAMGIGKLGGISRRELMRRGSVLNYVHLGRARIAGQPSLRDIRRWTLSVRR